MRFNEHAVESLSNLIEYGNGPVATSAYQTPASKVEKERRKGKKDRDQARDEKRDKKRKRLHVDIRDTSPREGDEIMTDAPPVLHTGLTGGLNRLFSRPSVFPPSPDYSGGDAGDASPASPLKKPKHSNRGRVDTISNNIMSLISIRTPSRERSEDRPRRKHRRHRDHSERPAQKMLEYKPMDSAVISEDSQNQMVVFQPRAEFAVEFHQQRAR